MEGVSSKSHCLFTAEKPEILNMNILPRKIHCWKFVSYCLQKMFFTHPWNKQGGRDLFSLKKGILWLIKAETPLHTSTWYISAGNCLGQNGPRWMSAKHQHGKSVLKHELEHLLVQSCPEVPPCPGEIHDFRTMGQPGPIDSLSITPSTPQPHFPSSVIPCLSGN